MHAIHDMECRIFALNPNLVKLDECTRVPPASIAPDPAGASAGMHCHLHAPNAESGAAEASQLCSPGGPRLHRSSSAHAVQSSGKEFEAFSAGLIGQPPNNHAAIHRRPASCISASRYHSPGPASERKTGQPRGPLGRRLQQCAGGGRARTTPPRPLRASGDDRESEMIVVDADAFGAAHSASYGKKLGLSVRRGSRSALPARPTLARPGILKTLHVDMS
jgi:hypothetical protein